MKTISEGLRIARRRSPRDRWKAVWRRRRKLRADEPANLLFKPVVLGERWSDLEHIRQPLSKIMDSLFSGIDK
jgi:hypothetical protein